LPALPVAWRAYLLDTATASAAAIGAQVDADTWDGPSADELLGRALQQPGARQRRNGVKFQCPGCRAEGHDQHQDNALVRRDGRWGCALDAEHRYAIGVALGVVVPDGVMPGSDVTITAADLDADWSGTF
jgi:hypothetical protein